MGTVCETELVMDTGGVRGVMATGDANINAGDLRCRSATIPGRWDASSNEARWSSTVVTHCCAV